jgi:hypothetical protein
MGHTKKQTKKLLLETNFARPVGMFPAYFFPLSSSSMHEKGVEQRLIIFSCRDGTKILTFSNFRKEIFFVAEIKCYSFWQDMQRRKNVA